MKHQQQRRQCAGIHQLVTNTGKLIAIASTTGRPHPSPHEGNTFIEASELNGQGCRHSPTHLLLHTVPVALPSVRQSSSVVCQTRCTLRTGSLSFNSISVGSLLRGCARAAATALSIICSSALFSSSRPDRSSNTTSSDDENSLRKLNSCQQTNYLSNSSGNIQHTLTLILHTQSNNQCQDSRHQCQQSVPGLATPSNNQCQDSRHQATTSANNQWSDQWAPPLAFLPFEY